MTDSLGPVAYESEPSGYLGSNPYAPTSRHYSEATARDIDCAVKELVLTAAQNAKRILETHRTILERGASLLLAKETLGASDLVALFEGDLNI